VFVVAEVAGAAAECIVVRVVASDRTDGAGEENVLSAPRPELTPQPAVVVASPEDAPWEGAASECATSVDIVAAVDLLPIVGGGCPSSDRLTDCLSRWSDEVLKVFVPVGTVENDWWPLVGAAEVPFTRPDSGYGLLFFDTGFFELDFIWYVFRFPFVA